MWMDVEAHTSWALCFCTFIHTHDAHSPTTPTTVTGPIHLRGHRVRRPQRAGVLGAALYLSGGRPGQDGAGEGPALPALQGAAGPGAAGAGKREWGWGGRGEG